MDADHRRDVVTPSQLSTQTGVATADAAHAPFGIPGSLVGRFVIRERLGTGGMGEVYRAEDTQLKRTVAIKRLVHHADDHSGSNRLLKEAQRASALNHPRIAGVYDVVSTGSELLLVMEYIDGVTLRERMKGPIGLSDFCAIAMQCSEALAAAHEKGILHGDLKPANIMLTSGGQVKVCDFGLARRLPRSDGATESTTTQPVLAGTPAYLAPEAILEKPLDERADIFSLGVVFYQMLAARNPFAADGLIATLDRILHATPEPLDRVNPHVPARLARTIERMLEKNPRDRYGSAAAVGDVLSAIQAHHARTEHRRQRMRRLQVWSAAAGVVAVTALAAVLNGPALPQNINLVVLPFTVTGTSGREYFTQGLTDALNDQLSRLTVKSNFQVATVADRRTRNVANAQDARDQLGANLALAGSLEYAAQQIQVTTELLDTKTNRPLRTQTLTASVADPGAVYAQVVRAVVRMLGLDLTPQEQALLTAGTTLQPSALDFYFQGRGYLRNYDRIESVDSAIALFRRALGIDPRYARAYAGLGEAYWRKHDLTGASTWVEPARGNCESALGNDESKTLAEPHVCLGMVLNGTGEYERAAAEYDVARQRDPTNDLAWVGLATAYEELGRHEDAEQTYRQAIALRSHYWGGYNNLGAYYYRSGRFTDALRMFRRVVDLAPDSFRGHSSVGATEFMLDHTAEAEAAFMTSLGIRPNYVAASNLATLYYFEGKFRLAADYFSQALKLERGSYQLWSNHAEALERLGRRDEALEAFRQARRLATERLEVNPKDANVLLAVAEASAALDEMDQAWTALSAAQRLAPTEPHTLFLIAAFYETRLNDRAEALKWLAKAVDNGQTWREIDRAPALRELRADPAFKKLRNPP